MFLDISRALLTLGRRMPFDVHMPLDLDRDDILSCGEAHVTGHVVSTDDRLLLVGELTLVAQVQCARCLVKSPVSIHAQLNETFMRKGDLEFSDTDDADDRDDIYLYSGKSIDLTPPAQGAAALQMPMRFLCQTGCQGLCPACGKDRNLGECICSPTQKDGPFAALQALMKDDKEVDPHGST